MKLEKIILTAIFFAFGTFSAAVFADEGAEVLNWGQDRLNCSASCGDIECVTGGQLAIIVNEENATLVCTSGEWLLDPPDRALRTGVDCGDLGTGQAVITPSGVVNFVCHTD